MKIKSAILKAERRDAVHEENETVILNIHCVRFYEVKKARELCFFAFFKKKKCKTVVFFANTCEGSSNARSGANVKTERHWGEVTIGASRLRYATVNDLVEKGLFCSLGFFKLKWVIWIQWKMFGN